MARLLLKTSICATLTLCTDGALSSAGEQCAKICESIKAEISSSEACAKSRKSLPRPKIGRFCQEGFDEAFILTCGELCSLYGTSRAIPNHQGEACDKRKREVPRPVAHKACVDGFKAGLASTTALTTQRIESMEEAMRKSLVGSNLAILKKADAERDALDEVGRGREAEQEEQRKEEQERARKAVEEKSAEVKREKEALSEKQELETAQAAEQAKRQKRTVEEERQARIKAAVDAKEEPKHSKLDDSIAGAVGPPASTLWGQAWPAPGADDRADTRHEPPYPKTFEHLEDDLRAGAGLEENPATGTGDAPSQEMQDLEHIEALDAVGADAGLVEVVPAPAGEENGGDTDDANASRPTEVPEDGHSHEVLAVDPVGGSRPPTPDNKANEVRAGEVAKTTSTAEIESYVRSEDGLSIKLPNDARFIEVLTADHVLGFEPPPAAQDSDKPLDMLDGANPTGEITAPI